MTLFEEEVVATAAPSGPSSRVRLTVAYDGSGFRGFAEQKTVPTVGGALRAALEKVLGHPIELTCAGRTDAGVHAWGQVVTFTTFPRHDDAAAELDVELLRRSINKMLEPAVVIRDAAVAAPDFDARRSALGRRYRYTVLNGPVLDPFTAKVAWHIEGPLDLRAMQMACDPLIGEHDFRSFCRQPSGHPPGPLVRRMAAASWIDLEDGRLRFDVEANAFCQQMVRALVGTLVDVGIGKRKAGEMAGILRAGSRSAAGQIAPPHGLCLWEV
nr:tRNA pseudouridine(38-40) synthase TruA [Actinomycetota bacterium]